MERKKKIIIVIYNAHIVKQDNLKHGCESEVQIRWHAVSDGLAMLLRTVIAIKSVSCEQNK